MARPSKPWYRTGKGGWYCWHGGKLVSLGVKGRENEAEAVRAWHRLLGGAEAVRPPKGEARPKASAPPPPADGPTVGEVVGQFLADCEGRMKPNTLRGYRDFLRPFAARHGSGLASALTPVQAEAYSRKAEWSQATRASFLGALVTAFRWARRARLIAGDPLAGVRVPPKPSRGASALISAEEYARLLSLASPTFGRFLRVLWDTGARPGEVAAITAANFDAEARVVLLREHKTAHKGKSRAVFVTAEVAALLSQLAGRHPTGPLLRTCHGKAWGKSTLVREMLRLRRLAGVPHATLYGFRHSFATDALANGVPDAQVAALLGHSGTAMLHKHYSHLTARAKALKDALGKVRG